MMNVQHILDHVEFIVDHNGKPKSAVIDMKLWDNIITRLEDFEEKEEGLQLAAEKSMVVNHQHAAFPLIKSKSRQYPLTTTEVVDALDKMNNELDLANANFMRR